ncbi:MAG TPA: ABC transporter permease [Puia sp.]|jgi:predicted permease
MFKSYLHTTLRNLWKNKTYGFLNIFGLSIGIACAGLIFLWVESEMSHDNSFPKKDQIYAAYNNQTFSGLTRTFDDTPGPLGPAMQTEIPGVASTCRTSWANPLFSNGGDQGVYETGTYADPSLFSIFSLSFVQGNAKDAFRELNAIVITEKMAKHFFGDEKNVIGRTLKMDTRQNYTVSGVIRDLPENSTLQLDWAAPFEIYRKDNSWLSNWGANALITYVELSPNANADAVNARLSNFVQTKDPTAGGRPIMLPMKDWYLRNDFKDGKQSGDGRIEYVRLFTGIAWIILLIACINFMNLATARSEKRAREVGVRKVLGAGRQWLIIQFIGESIFLSALSVGLGLLLISLLLPPFNLLVNQQLTLGLQNPLHLLAILCITLICGLVAGSYPALYLSSFNPIHVFKGLKIKGRGASFTRKSLVVLQFTVSIVLIISTVIVYRQVQHIKSRDLGYNKDHLLDIPLTGNMIKDYPSIRQDLLNTGVVDNTALAKVETINTSYNTTGFSWEGKDENKPVLISVRNISPEYIRTLGMQIVEGRDFKDNAVMDSTHVLITGSMARIMGKGSPLGKLIRGRTQTYEVVGVVKDYIYGDLYGRPDPVIFFADPEDTRFLYVRTRPNTDPAEALVKIGAVIKKDNPAYPFSYHFIDDQFNARFTAESLIGKLSGIFASLAILISCLGLFGLAAYTAEQRTREIGIRKVLGASVTGITSLLSKDFLLLVLVSNIIAIPLAAGFMHHWLEGYAYHIDMSWWVFVTAGLVSLLIALVTVSFQSIKAALSNPIKSLRTE